MSQVMEYQMFINGQWTSGHAGEKMEVINPCTQEGRSYRSPGYQARRDDALGYAREPLNPGYGRTSLLKNGQRY
jgi:acyl-CoA reductase-like NAD-dependent aldehyde dehydrogenase